MRRKFILVNLLKSLREKKGFFVPTITIFLLFYFSFIALQGLYIATYRVSQVKNQVVLKEYVVINSIKREVNDITSSCEVRNPVSLGSTREDVILQQTCLSEDPSQEEDVIKSPEEFAALVSKYQTNQVDVSNIFMFVVEFKSTDNQSKFLIIKDITKENLKIYRC